MIQLCTLYPFVSDVWREYRPVTSRLSQKQGHRSCHRQFCPWGNTEVAVYPRRHGREYWVSPSDVPTFSETMAQVMPSTVLSLKKHGRGQQGGKVSFSYVPRMSVVYVGSFCDVTRQQKRGRPAKIFTFLKTRNCAYVYYVVVNTRKDAFQLAAYATSCCATTWKKPEENLACNT